MQRDLSAQILQIDARNDVQITNDGMFMEAVLAGSLIVASRLKGVNGICLQDFIPAVFAQIQLSEELLDFTLKDTGNKSLDEFMKNFDVPFLAPPNQQWPDFVENIPNSNFGNIFRTVNSDKIDVNSNFGMTGEAKDHAKNISSDVMDSILRRICDENVSRNFHGLQTPPSRIHIVFVNSLLKREYFSSSSKKSFTPYQSYYCCAKVEVDLQSKTLYLRDIKGLSKLSEFDFNEDSTLVLFYELKMETEQEVSQKRKQSEIPVGKEMKIKM